MEKIAVVILNYNGLELIKRFLPSVVKYSQDVRIIVVDNGSNDGSLELIISQFKEVETISIGDNKGFCGGYNFALKLIDCQYYVLLNSDVEVTANWIKPLEFILDNDPQVAVVQPKILSSKQPSHFEYAGAAGGLIDTLGYPFCRGRMFHFLEEDIGQYDDCKQIFWASGACMMIRAGLFHAMDGFDEEFFSHMEEIDLCWRLQRAGYKIWYDGNSKVYHLGGGTLSSINPRKTYFNFKNGLSLLAKNLPSNELYYKVPTRILLDWIAAIMFCFWGSFYHGLAVIKAHYYFFLGIKNEILKRKKNDYLMYRKISSQYNGSIVWDFFIAGKRTIREQNKKN